MALGLNQVAAIAGSFIGLILGGVLGPVSWRLVFLVSVPFGVMGTVWSYLKLKELGVRKPAKLDLPGNLTFNGFTSDGCGSLSTSTHEFVMLGITAFLDFARKN